MFSGLTNQVSSLFSKNEEQVPTPPQSATATEDGQAAQSFAPLESGVENNNADSASPTKASGGSMFSNVTGKVSGWLPSSIPTVSMPSVSMPSMPTVSMPAMPSIPGLRKSHPASGEEGGEAAPELAVEAQASQAEKDEDDRSSATGGADSRTVSEKGSPTEEQAGAVGNVTHKVTAGAKAFGSFFSGVVNKAGDRIKESVKHNPILGDFNKEQEAFIKDQSGKNTDAGICPWVGHKNEDKIKDEVLSLSSDRRNFVRAPPAGNEFEFNYDNSYPVALALMAEDSALEKMRFDLVPKIITEENFWKNYFYRVSLIIQAGELGTLGTDEAFGKREDDDVSKSSNSKNSIISKEQSSNQLKNKNTTFHETDVIKKTSGDGDEEEWEKNLAAEDFEVVGDSQNADSDIDDLK